MTQEQKLLLRAVLDAIGNAIQDDDIALATKTILQDCVIVVDGHHCETSERGAGRIVAEARCKGESYLDFYMRRNWNTALEDEVIKRFRQHGYKVIEEEEYMTEDE